MDRTDFLMALAREKVGDSLTVVEPAMITVGGSLTVVELHLTTVSNSLTVVEMANRLQQMLHPVGHFVAPPATTSSFPSSNSKAWSVSRWSASFFVLFC
jgi:hypothetical protein